MLPRPIKAATDWGPCQLLWTCTRACQNVLLKHMVCWNKVLLTHVLLKFNWKRQTGRKTKWVAYLIAFGPWTGPCPWLHVSFSLTRARCHAMYCNHYSTWRPCLWRVVLQAGPYQTWHPDTQPMEMPSIELFLDNHAFQRIAYPGPCHKHIVLFWKQQIIQMVLHTKSYKHTIFTLAIATVAGIQ